MPVLPVVQWPGIQWPAVQPVVVQPVVIQPVVVQPPPYAPSGVWVVPYGEPGSPHGPVVTSGTTILGTTQPPGRTDFQLFN